MGYARWALIIFLAVLSAALIAGPHLGDVLIWSAGLLLLGLILRENEKAKKLRREKRPDNE